MTPKIPPRLAGFVLREMHAISLALALIAVSIIVVTLGGNSDRAVAASSVTTFSAVAFTWLRSSRRSPRSCHLLLVRRLRGTSGGADTAARGGPGDDSGWRAMRMAARLMPGGTGRRWLAEAESFLAEAPSELRRGAVRSYLRGAPHVIALSWTPARARRN